MARSSALLFRGESRGVGVRLVERAPLDRAAVRRRRRRRASRRPRTPCRSGWWSMGPRVAEFEAAVRRVRAAADMRSPSPTGRPRCIWRSLAAGRRPGRRGDHCRRSTSSPPRTRSRRPAPTPVFCDIVGAGDLNLDPADLEAAITPRDEGDLSSLHYGGFACDMDAVLELAERHGLVVIEDAAHAPARHLARPRVRHARARSAASASSRTRTCRSARAGWSSRTTTSSPRGSGCSARTA